MIRQVIALNTHVLLYHVGSLNSCGTATVGSQFGTQHRIRSITFMRTNFFVDICLYRRANWNAADAHRGFRRVMPAPYYRSIQSGRPMRRYHHYGGKGRPCPRLGVGYLSYNTYKHAPEMIILHLRLSEQGLSHGGVYMHATWRLGAQVAWRSKESTFNGPSDAEAYLPVNAKSL